MKVSLLIDPKKWMRCIVCGHDRKIPKIYRGRMYWKQNLNKYVCNRCDFSLDPKELQPKSEFIEMVNLMKQL